MNKIYDLKDRSYWFGINIINLLKKAPRNSASHVISDQLIRSSMSIGANIVKGSAAASKKDFINFYNHALKSAVETRFWLKSLVDSELIDKREVDEYIAEVEELSKILGSIVSKSRR